MAQLEQLLDSITKILPILFIINLLIPLAFLVLLIFTIYKIVKIGFKKVKSRWYFWVTVVLGVLYILRIVF